jgi:hypothetical protein
LAAVAAAVEPAVRPTGARRLEQRILLAAVGVIALHVADDSSYSPNRARRPAIT